MTEEYLFKLKIIIIKKRKEKKKMKIIKKKKKKKRLAKIIMAVFSSFLPFSFCLVSFTLYSLLFTFIFYFYFYFYLQTSKYSFVKSNNFYYYLFQKRQNRLLFTFHCLLIKLSLFIGNSWYSAHVKTKWQ